MPTDESLKAAVLPIELAELRDAQQRMVAVLAATEVGTWTYEIGPNRVVADANMSRLFGVSAEDAVGGRLEAYLDCIHPEDRPRVEATITEAVGRGSKFESEYRLILPNGSVRTVIARGSVECDENGRALRLPGVVLDITKRVRAEEERKELSDELAQERRVVDTMLSSIADFAYVFDKEGRFEYANKALLDLWGMTLKDAVGKNFFDLQYPDELAAKLQHQIQQVIATKKPVSDQTPYTSPTGVGGVYEYIFWPVFDAEGGVDFVAGSTRNITQNQAVIESLKRSEEDFRTLAETLPDSVWTTDTQGEILWTNSVLSRTTGLTREELRHHYRSLVHPEDKPATMGAWDEALKTGAAVEFQHRVRQADGSWRWHLVRAAPACDADGTVYRWIGTSTDVHDQRELQAKLERSEAHFRQLADAIPQLAWMAKPDGWLFWYNQRWYDYTGTKAEEMEGWGWKKVHDPEVLPQVMANWTACIDKGEPFDMTFPLKGADGVFRPFLSRAMPFRDETGQVILWFGTNTDISEQRRIVQEREELLASERAARSAAEHANRMKDEFLATLSHELRSPLNAIFGWTQILRESDGDAETLAEGIEVIDRNVRMQTQLIDDLLDMSRIISGKLRLDVRAMVLGTCIDAAIETVRHAAETKGIRIEKIIDPLAGPISGDPARIQQIIWNLLSNAIKFTPRGGRVQVLLERVNSHLEISVADTGQGIDAGFLPHVFDRFRQEDAATNRKHGGLGLGLAIVKQLVELHGGSIHVESEGEGQGATFIVCLPLKTVLAPADDTDERQHPKAFRSTPALWKNDSLAGLKVLAVDDEKDSRDLLQRVLEECGAHVIPAASAAEALSLLTSQRPDVLVSDIGMPGVDGYEFIRQVRTLSPEEGGRIPAVALTAFARSEDRTRALLAGFLTHLSKPVEPPELIATISAVAGRMNGG